MLKTNRIHFVPTFCHAIVLWVAIGPWAALAQHQLSGTSATEPHIAPAPDEGRLAIKRFAVPPGLKVDLWAAEPLLANPVAFNFDEMGRAYVCETFRLGAGVDDIRGIMDWLDEELAARTVDDRTAEMKRHLGDRFAKYTERSERIRLLEDRSGGGKADHATVFADGFNTPLDGIGAGVLAHQGTVWYANIPNLWQLRDTNADGVADSRTSLHYGFGVRVGFLGHDLHGLHFGPDGKIYFSIGDRGSNIRVDEGRTVGEPDTGCVFRCNPDGSELEVFATGLRNPQDLVFDQYGNLFTGDNNSDSGDKARWVYLVEGGDSGWRVGFQFMENPYSRGPFNAEKLWYPPFPGQAANIVPPVANIASGPSGVAYFPGTGLPEAYRDHFFLTDFRGGAANSGVHTFTLKAKGAGFELIQPEHFLWSILATDVKFGVDGGLYVSDWVEGWSLTGKGRLYRVHAANLDADPTVLGTKRLLAEGFNRRSLADLSTLLSHPDMRVRLEAQFAMADRGAPAIPALRAVLSSGAKQLARLHAIWGLGQIMSRFPDAATQSSASLDVLTTLLRDSDPEVRAQSAKVLGERRYVGAYEGLVRLVQDPSARVRFFAALSLGKLGRREALPAICRMLQENGDEDPYLRHAGVMALTGIGDGEALRALAENATPAIRRGALLAMRRLQRPEIAIFLKDSDPSLVLEAARAINDQPVNGAKQDLAALLGSSMLDRFLEDKTLLAGSETHELDALLRRVLNAALFVGTPKTAEALAAFAERKDAPQAMRVEAIQELGDWAHPSGRDRVVGLWRPSGARHDAQTAAQVLEPRLTAIFDGAPNDVQIALLRTVSRLNLASAGPMLDRIVADSTAAGKVRGEALSVIASLDLPTLESALQIARNDGNEDLRKAATPLESKVKASDPVPRLAATLQNGTIGEEQIALKALATLPAGPADTLIGQWLDRLKADQVPNAVQLDVLEAAGKRSDPALKQKLEQYESSRAGSDPLGPFQETLFGGSAEEGKIVFFEKQEAQCVRCHRINSQGGDVGPDLSHIGAEKNRHYLLESILLPNKQIAPGFDSVTLVLKDGDSVAGVFKKETATEIVLNTPENGLVTLQKADIQARSAALSPMPEGLGQVLSKQDLRNLVEFLSSLR